MRLKKPLIFLLVIGAICLADPKFRARLAGEKPVASAPAVTISPRYANAQVVMYSLTTCPHCKLLRAELERNGIPFREDFLDISESAALEFNQMLQSHGVREAVGTPSLMVNGKLMLNNPGVPAILLELHKQS